MLKGSGRSIPGVHLRDMLDLVDKSDSGLIERFGGHAMAAGLSLHKNNLQRFQTAFEHVLRQHVAADCFDNVVDSDGEIDASDLSFDLAMQLEQAGPWGQRFPVPSFTGTFRVMDQRVLAGRHLKFVVKLVDGGKDAIDAILFHARDEELKTNYQNLDLHYELNINEFRGEQGLQLIIRHIL